MDLSKLFSVFSPLSCLEVIYTGLKTRNWRQIRLASSVRGQTALEYMLMVAVIFSILALVVAMTMYVEGVGVSLGSTIDSTRGQVIDWILT